MEGLIKNSVHSGLWAILLIACGPACKHKLLGQKGIASVRVDGKKIMNGINCINALYVMLLL